MKPCSRGHLGVGQSITSANKAYSSSFKLKHPIQQQQQQVARQVACCSTVQNGNGADNKAPAKPPKRKRVFSGIQPTGDIHLGNYMGAVKNWVELQENYECFFCVVDLHSMTMPHDPVELRQKSRTCIATNIAAGIDPTRSTLYIQSHVRAHAELSWLLTCATPEGWLRNMLQYKEKSIRAGESVGAGLLIYPVLQAADILLYASDLVPVGEDQRQHIELTRDIANRFNKQFGGNKWKKRGGFGGKVLKVPEMLIPKAGAKIKSLTDGTSKMSKSNPDPKSRIGLMDSPEEIAGKIKSAKTDAGMGLLEWDNPERPECGNLLSVYGLCSGMDKDAVLARCADMSWGTFKSELADVIIQYLAPMQTTYKDLINDPAQLDGIIRDGADRANAVAEGTLARAKDAMGLYGVPERVGEGPVAGKKRARVESGGV